MDEASAEVLTRRISSIGERFGFVGDQGNDDRRKHKYDVWIASQVRKELIGDPPEKQLIDRENELFMVLDWAIENKPDLMAMDFEEAFQQQKRWNERLAHQGVFRPRPIDTERVVYKCSNGHFFYLLNADDLQFEAAAMSHCVGGDHYKKKVNNQRAIIISLRDEKNQPHVTIEVTVDRTPNGLISGTVLQQQGKGNSFPAEKYRASLREFALFSAGVSPVNGTA